MQTYVFALELLCWVQNVHQYIIGMYELNLYCVSMKIRNFLLFFKYRADTAVDVSGRSCKRAEILNSIQTIMATFGSNYCRLRLSLDETC